MFKRGMYAARLDGKGTVRCVRHVRMIDGEQHLGFGRNPLSFQKSSFFKEVTQHGTELKGRKAC